MGLASRIAKASAAVGGRLKADSRNNEQKYDYISADKILSVCGQALAEQEVTVIPAIAAEVVDVVDRGNGKYRYDAAVTFHMIVADDEKEITAMWVGRGSDYTVPDKALYKAITSGHKYFLMKLLNIGEGNEDGEHEPAEESPRQQPQRQTQQPPAQATHRQPAPPTTNGNGHKPPTVEAPADDVASWAANPKDVLFRGYTFRNPAEAKGWGMAMGVFDDDKHADNAYNALKRDKSPKTPQEMWDAWINDIARRVNEKEAEPVTA